MFAAAASATSAPTLGLGYWSCFRSAFRGLRYRRCERRRNAATSRRSRFAGRRCARCQRRFFCRTLGLGFRRSGLRVGRLPGRALHSPPLAPVSYLWRRNRRRDERFPVESDVGVLRLERATHMLRERLAPDLHIGRGPEPIEDSLTLLAAARRRRLHQIEMLVSALISRKSEEGHALLSLLGRSCGRPGRSCRLLDGPRRARRLIGRT